MLRGNPGKRKLNTDEPQYDPAPSLDPPSTLAGVARDTWLANIGGLQHNGLATIPFLQVLEVYCIARAEYLAAEAQVKREGTVTAGRLGTRVVNPRCKVRDHAHKRMLDAARELGLTPAASSRISANPAKGVAPAQSKLTRMQAEGAAVIGKIG